MCAKRRYARVRRTPQFVAVSNLSGVNARNYIFVCPYDCGQRDEDEFLKTVDTHCFAVRDKQTQKRRLRCPSALLSSQRTRR